MLQELRIQRFKSIRKLTVACRKVNVFIGPPDTGKTNILEALQFCSRLGWSLPIDTSLRLSGDIGLEALFYRQFLDQPFLIGLDDLDLSGTLRGAERTLEVAQPRGSTQLRFGTADQFQQFRNLTWLRFYSYASSSSWGYVTPPFEGDRIVSPPDGGNLGYIARHQEPVYNFLRDLVAELGWKLRFDQNTKSFRMSDVRETDIIDYNLELLSDSIKRFFFYGAILLQSRETTLVFDEPDVQAFPPYPKELGRLIAEDETNQFFLTTHNPYLLSELAQKTPTENLAIFACGRDDDGGTTARMLEPSEVADVIEWGANVFFNLEKFKR